MSMMRELQQWLEPESVGIMLKKEAANLVDGTWVPKWKIMAIGGKEQREVKGRWTLRGLKDRQSQVETLGGTAARYSTRVVNSHACQN
eukprot:6131662-Pyramimonas_sp.AAC.1